MALAAVAVNGAEPEDIQKIIDEQTALDESKRTCPKESSDPDVARHWNIENTEDEKVIA